MPKAYNDDLDLMARLRITVTLSEEVHKILSEWADEEVADQHQPRNRVSLPPVTLNRTVLTK